MAAEIDPTPPPALGELCLHLTPVSSSEEGKPPIALTFGCMHEPEQHDVGGAGGSAAGADDSDGSSVYSEAAEVTMALWAYVWSCNVYLCEIILALPLAGVRVHELGAGCALAAVAAAAAGAQAVVASDVVTTAAPAVQVSMAAQPSACPVTYMALDWLDAQQRVAAGGSADLVLGSDVAYAAAAAPALAATTAALLAPGGIAVIADPCRLGADGLLAELQSLAAADGALSARLVTVRNAWSPGNAAVRELRLFLLLRGGGEDESPLQAAVLAGVQAYAAARSGSSLDDAVKAAGVAGPSHTLHAEVRRVGAES